MGSLKSTIKKIFKGAGKSFYRFPGSIISAIVISIIAFIRIEMVWEVEEQYYFLFNSIQIAFILGAISSMAAVVLDEIGHEKKETSFIVANGFGILLALASFSLLYFFGGIEGKDGIKYLSDIASARMAMSVFVSGILFIYFISKSKIIGSFSDSFFITHRAFAISAIYGFVIMIGVSGVLGAFQTLVYRDMSYNVYQYLGVIVGFFTFTVFLGYFPSFRGEEKADALEEIVEQPRFIYVLFEYILVPIMIALTVVLLIWSARVVFTGMDVSFNQLSGIASSYVIVGIWLHIMVHKHMSKMALFYKKVYPFSALLVLVFEAWALVVQLSKFGLKTAEYSFGMLWIFTLISVLLLIVLKDKAYRKIAITSIVISIIWVLPFIGYQDITFNSQVNRLEERLMGEGLLVAGEIVMADGEVEREVMGKITDGVDFISRSEKTNTPAWFKENLNDGEVFKDTFGFEKTYGIYPEMSDYKATGLMLKIDYIDISDYDLSLNLERKDKFENSVEFEGKDGNYQITWTDISRDNYKISVKLDGEIIIEEELDEYLSNLVDKYPPQVDGQKELGLEEMSVLLESDSISLLLVFDNINIYFDEVEDKVDYYTNIQGIYLKYK